MRIIIAVAALIILTATLSFARGRSGGGSSGMHSIGVGFAYNGANQDDLNTAIDGSNTIHSLSMKQMGSAYEIYTEWMMRFSGTMFSIGLRPAYFTQSSGADFKLTGYNIMPLLRITPLENDFIKFFMQFGIGYGSLSGTIDANTDSAKFSGSAFGAQGGIGALFCFTPSHCMNIEGNLRYMPIERNIVSSCTGFTGSGQFSQCAANKELEIGTNSNDVKTSMSGVIGLIGYVMKF